MKKFLSAATVFVLVAAIAALAQGPGGPGGRAGGRGPAGPGLTLTSPDIQDGGIIPDKFTGKAGAAVVSPKLEWTNVPAGTMSFALLLHDPDVAMGKKLDDVTHWMVFSIPGTARELPSAPPATDAKMADGTIQIKNTAGRVGYLGPGAPAAGPYHHYTFMLFALDTTLDLTDAASRTDILMAMDGHILAKGILAGRFHQ
jgi:Raf kinase inhibitor-like YbhB/YbcL family protein